jgi:hypothetical protein
LAVSTAAKNFPQSRSNSLPPLGSALLYRTTTCYLPSCTFDSTPAIPALVASVSTMISPGRGCPRTDVARSNYQGLEIGLSLRGPLLRPLLFTELCRRLIDVSNPGDKSSVQEVHSEELMIFEVRQVCFVIWAPQEVMCQVFQISSNVAENTWHMVNCCSPRPLENTIFFFLLQGHLASHSSGQGFEDVLTPRLIFHFFLFYHLCHLSLLAQRETATGLTDSVIVIAVDAMINSVCPYSPVCVAKTSWNSVMKFLQALDHSDAHVRLRAGCHPLHLLTDLSSHLKFGFQIVNPHCVAPSRRPKVLPPAVAFFGSSHLCFGQLTSAWLCIVLCGKSSGQVPRGC